MTIKNRETESKTPKSTSTSNGQEHSTKQAAQAPAELTPEMVSWIKELATTQTATVVRENAELRDRLGALEAKQASNVNADRLRSFLKDESIAAVAEKAEKAKTLQDARDVSAKLYDASMEGLIDLMKLKDTVPRTFHIDTYELIGVIAVGVLVTAAAAAGGHTYGKRTGHKHGLTEGYGHGASDMRALQSLEAAANDVKTTPVMVRRVG